MGAEQTRLLYAYLPSSFVINVLLALILAAIQSSDVPAHSLLIWLALVGGVQLARTALLLAWHRGQPVRATGIASWLFLFRAGVIANGVAWGTGAWLLFPADNIVHQVFLAFVVSGICAGAITSLAVDRLSTFGFIMPTLVPLIVQFTLEGDEHTTAMAVMVWLFLIFITLNAARIERSFRENTLLRIDAEKREHSLEEALNLLRKVANRVPGVVFQFRLRPDGSSCFPFASEGTRELFRLSPEDIREDASGVFAICHPDDYAALMESIRFSAQNLTPWHHEVRTRFGDGTERWLFGNALPQRETDGSVLWHGFITDITERKIAETDLHIAATAFEAQEGILIAGADSVILRVNQSFTEITGYTPEEAIGRTPRMLSSGRHDAAFYSAMWQSLLDTGTWQGEIWNRRKNGEIYLEWLIITAVKGKTGEVTHYVATLTDITKRKSAEEQIKNLAYYDPLTHLPNRRLLQDRLQQALATSSRNRRNGVILFIDLDNFKTLNDTLGHDKGDMLLQQVALRLTSSVREGDTVARLGGDEFVVMLEDLSEHVHEAAAHAELVGEKILANLNQPYQLAEREYHSTPSIGVTLFGGHQQSMDELLKQADLAMYQAKASGRNALRFFDPEMQSVVTTRAALEVDLRQAIINEQFRLHYQPQADGDGRITGFEVLLRWPHPERGMIPPDQFIPLSEEIGLILPIGQWVLKTACEQLEQWSAHPETAHLTMSVNVSAKQFRHPNFVAHVLSVLDQTRIAPDKLKLELTESLLLHDVEDIIVKMTALKTRGVSFSLDDFGTGYSSLSYLKRLPLDQLKIDQSFVREVLTDANDAAIARTVVALAQSLGLAVIAEGVETEAQRDFLFSHGCRNYQGYLFGKPMSADQIRAFMLSNHTAG
ncbi:MAG: EAL domain-containing protein [Nitrosomonadales bacterium]|nr:EAL domain-containing protein [Nitrosomonadales bacterium]